MKDNSFKFSLKSLRENNKFYKNLSFVYYSHPVLHKIVNNDGNTIVSIRKAHFENINENISLTNHLEEKDIINLLKIELFEDINIKLHL